MLFFGSTNAATQITGNISGSGSLVQAGTGTLTLSGTGSYWGGTTLSLARWLPATAPPWARRR